MTWGRENMKRALYVLLDVLAAGFLAGGYMIQYFAERKLGMVRWMNFQNMKIEREMPVDMLKCVALIVVAVLVGFVLFLYGRKRAYMGRTDGAMAGVMVILAVVYIGFAVLASTSVTGAYYFIMPMLGAAVLMTAFRNMIAVATCKKP